MSSIGVRATPLHSMSLLSALSGMLFALDLGYLHLPRFFSPPLFAVETNSFSELKIYDLQCLCLLLPSLIWACWNERSARIFLHIYSSTSTIASRGIGCSKNWSHYSPSHKELPGFRKVWEKIKGFCTFLN